MAKYSNLIIVLLVAVALAIFATTPPSPLDADAPPEVFSAKRAMKDVRVIAVAPHPTGSAENIVVQEFLVQRLTAMGLGVTTVDGPLDDRSTKRLTTWLGRDATGIQMTNIIGTLPGSDSSKPAVLLMAHYDSVGGSPGAADDAAGVASILEIVRAIQAKGQAERDVIVLLTDAEESGLVGATQFFESNPLREKVGAVVNFEARGGGGRTSLFETSVDNGEAVRVYADNVSKPAASSLSVFVYRQLPNGTDLTAALDGDYAAYNFAFIGRPGLYHSPMATPENLDQASVQDMGAQGLALARALAFAEDLPAKSPDLTFFDLFGLTTIVFAPWWGWVILGFAAAGFAWSARPQFNRREVLAGAGRWLVLSVAFGVVIFGLNMLSGAGSGELKYYDRLEALPMLEIMALLVALGAFIFATRKIGGKSPSGWAGFALPLFILATAMQWFAPSAAYVLTVPLLLIGIAVVATTQIDGIAGRLVACVIAALVVGYELGLGHQLMQSLGADTPMAAVLPLGIATLAILPIWPDVERPKALWTVGGLIAAAALIALWVRLDPVADTVAVYALMK